MRTWLPVLVICVVLAWSSSSSALFLEVGTESVLLGESGESGQTLDALAVRLGHVPEVHPGLSVGASFAWRRQPYHTDWHPFAPSHSEARDAGRGSVPRSVENAHYLELSVLGRIGGVSGRLRPFGEGEFGWAAVGRDEGFEGDVFLGVRGGGAWWLAQYLAVRGTLGFRLYMGSERYTLPLSVELHVGF